MKEDFQKYQSLAILLLYKMRGRILTSNKEEYFYVSFLVREEFCWYLCELIKGICLLDIEFLNPYSGFEASTFELRVSRQRQSGIDLNNKKSQESANDIHNVPIDHICINCWLPVFKKINIGKTGSQQN